MDALGLGLQVLLTLALAAAVEVPVAAFYTRRKVRADVQAEAARVIETLKVEVQALKPRDLRHGVDPVDAANARWAKKAEKEQAAADTRAAIFAWLVETFGPEEARVITAWCPAEVMDAAVAAGENWRPRLEPVIRAAVKHRAANKSPSSAAPRGFALE